MPIRFDMPSVLGDVGGQSLLSANYPSPLFIMDTIINKEGYGNFLNRAKDVIDSVSLLGLYFYGVLIPNIVQSSGVTSKFLSPIISLSNFSPFIGLIAGVVSPYFYLGTGVKNYSINVRQISNIVNLGANRVARFGWGTEHMPINLDGVFYLKPFVEWDTHLNSLETPLGSLYKKFLSLVSSRAGSRRNTGYPTYPSLGEILSYVFYSFVKDFGQHTFFMCFLDKIYYGWIDYLTFSKNADSPMLLSYRLTFHAHPASGWAIYDIGAMKRGLSILGSTKKIYKVNDFISTGS